MATACRRRRATQHGRSDAVRVCHPQPAAREGQAGPGRKSERPIVPTKPGNAGGGKGPWFRNNAQGARVEEIGMDLETPVKIQKLQEALHAKAKASPGYRFYLLYDKVYRADILRFAWERCRDNGGVAGVDGQTFKDIA